MKALIFTMKIIWLSQLFLVGSFLQSHSQDLFQTEGEIDFDNYTINDGLSNNFITSIFQDHIGIMWIGTQNGLNRFDAKQFHVFKNRHDDTNSISSNFIIAMQEDKQGNLWVVTTAGIDMFDPFTGQFKKVIRRYELPQHRKITTLKIYDDILLAGTNAGLLKWNLLSGEISSQTANIYLSDKYITAIEMYKDSLLLIGTIKGAYLLNKYALNKNHNFKANDVRLILADTINCFFIDQHNKIFAGTNNGAYIIQNDSIIVNHHSYKGDDRSLWKYVAGISADSKDQIWFATNSNIQSGLFKYNVTSEDFTRYVYDEQNSKSLKWNYCTCILRDHSNGIWIGTS
ncbi:MAG TPA: two-component regulator propeller domain-containing protein, partial [Chitinophagaceae bacterium]|nr:two-component regulator propeller domain-containing protein [Chitinophagaceae bacterium]